MSDSIEKIYEEARNSIGTESATVCGRYPIEYEPIRRYCHMVEDVNPLFLDPEHAKTTKYGAVICPPFMVNILGRDSDYISPWPPRERPPFPPVRTPGGRNVNIAIEWEFFRPVRVGDRISCKERLADVYIKPVRLDPKAFWIVLERIFSNQGGEVVAISRNTMVRHRTPKEIEESERK